MDFHAQLRLIVWETVLETPSRLVDLWQLHIAVAYKARDRQMPRVEGAEVAAIEAVTVQVSGGPKGLRMLAPDYLAPTFVFDRLAAARGMGVHFSQMDGVREQMAPCWPYVERIPYDALCPAIETLVDWGLAGSEGMGCATRAWLIPSA